MMIGLSMIGAAILIVVIAAGVHKAFEFLINKRKIK